MNKDALSASEIKDSTRHWLRFFVNVCERLRVDFRSVKPEPIALLKQVIGGEKSLDELDVQHDIWSETLSNSPDFLNLNSTETMPLRVAVLMAGVRKKHSLSLKQVITDIEYAVEWLDFALTKLGHDPHEYDDLWIDSRGSWRAANA